MSEGDVADLRRRLQEWALTLEAEAVACASVALHQSKARAVHALLLREADKALAQQQEEITTLRQHAKVELINFLICPACSTPFSP